MRFPTISVGSLTAGLKLDKISTVSVTNDSFRLGPTADNMYDLLPPQTMEHVWGLLIKFASCEWRDIPPVATNEPQYFNVNNFNHRPPRPKDVL